VIADRLDVTPEELERQTGWELKPEGLCKDDRCVPLPDGSGADGVVDLTVVAERLGMPLVHDEGHELLGPRTEASDRDPHVGGLPPIVLADVDGRPSTSPRSRREGADRGVGVVVRLPHVAARVAATAHWLHPQGLEIVTVALDLEVDAARSWIERSGAEHPQLVDTATGSTSCWVWSTSARSGSTRTG
jgi:hypothetical protein